MGNLCQFLYFFSPILINQLINIYTRIGTIINGVFSHPQKYYYGCRLLEYTYFVAISKKGWAYFRNNQTST